MGLSYACKYGHAGLAQVLLDHGAKVDAIDGNGMTPLFYACSQGHTKAARLLLECGAKVDAQDPQSRTPLYLESIAGLVPIV